MRASEQLEFEFSAFATVAPAFRHLGDASPAHETTPGEGKRPAGRDPLLEAAAREILRALDLGGIAARVHVAWNARLQTTAGIADHSRTRIFLNPRLMEIAPDEVHRTFLHELAHLVAFARAGNRRIAPHGPEWRRACTELGIANERRCHNLPLPIRQRPRKHFYQCPSCQSVIARVRPFYRAVACIDCCRTFNRGCYHDDFRLVKLRRETGANDPHTIEQEQGLDDRQASGPTG